MSMNFMNHASVLPSWMNEYEERANRVNADTLGIDSWKIADLKPDHVDIDIEQLRQSGYASPMITVSNRHDKQPGDGRGNFSIILHHPRGDMELVETQIKPAYRFKVALNRMAEYLIENVI